MVAFLAMSTLRAIRESLIDASRRYSRLSHEVEDLAHDIILSALRRGFPLDGEAFLRGARAAARQHGAFLARSAARRRAREKGSAGEHVTGVDLDARDDAAEDAPWSVLSPSLRTTLLLLLQGLDKAELRLALGVTDAALRKRFQALREHGPLARPDFALPERTPAASQLRRSQVALLPRLSLAPVAHARRVLAASDPDGHGLIFAEALTPGHRTATSDAPTANARAYAKGKPCSTPKSRTSPSSSS